MPVTPSRELAALCRAFEAAGLRFLALKGPALAARFGDDPDSRPVADLDILVAREDVDRAVDLLEGRGFVARPRSNGLIRERHLIRPCPRLCVDLHWHVAPAHIRFPLSFEELWAGHQRVEVSGGGVPLPADIWLVLLTALYCVRELPLVEHRYFVDLARLANLLPAEAWQEVRQRAETARTLRIVTVALALAARCGERPLPEAAAASFPLDPASRRRLAELEPLLADPRAAHKRRFWNYLVHFFWHGRYREHWLDRVRPLLMFPLFLLLPEDDDVERAALTGRSPIVERVIRFGEVVGSLRRLRHERRREAAFERCLGDPAARFAPAPDVDLHIVDMEGVLLVRERQELYALSPTALWIWCQLEEGTRLGELARACSEVLGLPDAEALATVHTLLREWWRAGLLAGAPRLDPPPVREDVPSPWTEPLADPRERVALRLLDRCFEVAFTDRALAHQVAESLSHWRVRAVGEATRVHVFSRADEWLVTLDSQLVHRAPALDGLARELARVLVREAVRERPHALVIEGAVLRTDSGALLLAGGAAAQRGELAGILADAGWALLGDGFAVLEPPRFDAIVLALDSGSVADAAALARAWPVHSVVFLQPEPGAMAELTSAGAIEALGRLLEDCAARRPPLDSDLLAGLIAWIRDRQRHLLTFDDAREAAGPIVAHVGNKADAALRHDP